MVDRSSVVRGLGLVLLGVLAGGSLARGERSKVGLRPATRRSSGSGQQLVGSNGNLEFASSGDSLSLVLILVDATND